MQNVENVFVAKPNAAGAVWSAPQGTAVPTDAVTALPEAFNSLGYVSEDGIVNAIETESEPVTVFGGDTVLEVPTSRKETYVFTPIELNEHSLAETYGDDNVTVDAKGNLTIVHNGNERGFKPYVLEFMLSKDKVMRIVIPNGKVTEVGETAYANGAPVGTELTLSALPDSAGNGAYAYIAELV